jgi:hypothetical protein
MFTQVYQAYRQIYGETHTSTINTLTNLASTHTDLKEYDEAVKLYEVIIQARKEVDGEDSVNYAMALAMSAGPYRELG